MGWRTANFFLWGQRGGSLSKTFRIKGLSSLSIKFSNTTVMQRTFMSSRVPVHVRLVQYV